MGISTAVRWAEEAESNRAGLTPEDRADDNAIKTALSAVSAYIPSEALALYVSVAAVFNAPASAPEFKLALFIGGLVVVALLTLLSFKGWRVTWREYLRRLVVLAFGLLAFWLWVGAMPGSPWAGQIKYLDFTTETTIGYGAAVVLAAVALPVGARFFGLNKPR